MTAFAKSGIDTCHETVRFWWNRFGPTFAGDIRRQRVTSSEGLKWRNGLASLWRRGMAPP
jgi:transposase-like protein